MYTPRTAMSFQPAPTTRYRKKPLDPLNKVVPKNPRYEGVRSKVQCGPNVVSHEDKYGPTTARRYKREEFFKRSKGSSLAKLIQENDENKLKRVLVVDIRDKESFKECHITNAHHYPSSHLSRCSNELSQELWEFKNKEDHAIILYDWDERVAAA